LYLLFEHSSVLKNSNFSPISQCFAILSFALISLVHTDVDALHEPSTSFPGVVVSRFLARTAILYHFFAI
jgi:hypothetical protein